MRFRGVHVAGMEGDGRREERNNWGLYVKWEKNLNKNIFKKQKIKVKIQ